MMAFTMGHIKRALLAASEKGGLTNPPLHEGGRRRSPAGLLLLGSVILVIALFAAMHQTADAQTSPLHPVFALLDENGVNVLESGAPVSTMKTCGSCHDTEFIAQHSYHSDVGQTFNAAGGRAARGIRARACS
jgi:hypothetical protein